MKRLTWLLVCVMLFACAYAEFDADIETGADGTELLIRLDNVTDGVISGAKVVCGSEQLALPDIQPGSTYTGSMKITLPESGHVQARLVYPGRSEEITLPADYSGAELYVTLPDRAFSEGETVPVRLTLSNGGSTDILNAVIRTSSGYKSGLFSLKAGEYMSFETGVEISFPLEFSAEVLHGRTVIAAAAAGSIEKLVNNVTVTCVTSPAAQAGEGISVTVNIDNKGNTDYTAPRLWEAKAGEIAGLPAVIKAGSFVTVNTVLPALSETGVLKFTFEGRAENGETVSFSAADCRVQVSGAVQEIQTRALIPETEGETSFAAEALLGIATLKGLTLIAVYACAGVSVLLLTTILVRNRRRHRKH